MQYTWFVLIYTCVCNSFIIVKEGLHQWKAQWHEEKELNHLRSIHSDPMVAAQRRSSDQLDPLTTPKNGLRIYLCKQWTDLRRMRCRASVTLRNIACRTLSGLVCPSAIVSIQNGKNRVFCSHLSKQKNQGPLSSSNMPSGSYYGTSPSLQTY